MFLKTIFEFVSMIYGTEIKSQWYRRCSLLLDDLPITGHTSEDRCCSFATSFRLWKRPRTRLLPRSNTVSILATVTELGIGVTAYRLLVGDLFLLPPGNWLMRYMFLALGKNEPYVRYVAAVTWDQTGYEEATNRAPLANMHTYI